MTTVHDEEIARKLQDQEQRRSMRNFQTATLRSAGSSPALRSGGYGGMDSSRGGAYSVSPPVHQPQPQPQPQPIVIQQVPAPQPVQHQVYVQHIDGYGNPVQASPQPQATVIYQQVPQQQPVLQPVAPPQLMHPAQHAVIHHQPPPPVHQPPPVVHQPPPPPPPMEDTPATDAQLAMTLQQMEIDNAQRQQPVRRQSTRREIPHQRGLGHGRDNVQPAKTKGCGGDCLIM
eukprot:TRINITY_DN9548_c0_g1_i1.p1 TRINITY_DN9548_c0_g1~~TRINITY_DN9548_c0_g1_i1.p1  ORF type:complete len:230 (+),score=40.93 TRINITY_DN9548_c0_g1_i1:63-752(+)